MYVKFHLSVQSITLGVLLYLEFLIIGTQPYWVYIIDQLKGMFGAELNYGYFLIGFVLLSIIYISYLLSITIKRYLNSDKPQFGWFNHIFPFIIMLLHAAFIFYFYVQFGDEIAVAYQFFIKYNPVLFFIISSTLVAIFIKSFVLNYSNIDKTKFTAALLISLYLFSVVMPYALVPPNVISDEVPDKPIVISHRGGGFYAPENTIAALQYAVDRGITHIEVDVQISSDGELFILHDQKLTRTTNVEQVFPEKENVDASLFPIDELRQLDAGSWYVEEDPYQMISNGVIDQATVNSYKGEQIPLFTEVLNFVGNHSITLDIDFKEPTEDHPFADQYHSLVFDEINQSGLNPSQFIIFSEFKDVLQQAKQSLPGVTTMVDLDTSHPPTNNFNQLKTVAFHHSVSNQIIDSYVQNGFSVGVFVVISKIRYSQIWSMGVDYIITDRPFEYKDISKPSWNMQRSTYFTLLSLIFVLQLAITIFYIQRTDEFELFEQKK